MRFVGNTPLDKLFLERNVTYLVKAHGCAYGGSATNMVIHLVVKILKGYYLSFRSMVNINSEMLIT